MKARDNREAMAQYLEAMKSLIEIKKGQVGGELVEAWDREYSLLKNRVEKCFSSNRAGAKFDTGRFLRELELMSRWNYGEDYAAMSFFETALKVYTFVIDAQVIKAKPAMMGQEE